MSDLLSVLARHKYFTLVFAMLVLLLPVDSARAQGGVGSTRGLPESSGGSHRIQGSVYLPNGRRAEQGVSVRLEGNVTGTRRAATDPDGSFAFNALPAADYSVVVDAGPDYEPVRQQVVIYGTTGGTDGVRGSGQTIMLTIHLVPKGSPSAETNLFAGVPQKAVESYKKALQSARAKDSKKAVEQLNGALAIHPNFSLALRELGVQQLILGQPDKAVEALEAALKIAPDDAVSRLTYGIALLNQKKFAASEQQLRAAIKLTPTAPTAHMYLGMALINQQKLDDAEKELLIAVESNSTEVASAHRYLGGIYWGKRDYKRAADELEAYLKLAPSAPDAERTRAAIKDLRSKQQ